MQKIKVSGGYAISSGEVLYLHELRALTHVRLVCPIYIESAI
jgi:hypothetical protein